MKIFVLQIALPLILNFGIWYLLYFLIFYPGPQIKRWIYFKITAYTLRRYESREKNNWKKFKKNLINDMYVCCANKRGLELAITTAFNKNGINKEDVDISYDEEKNDKSETLFIAHITHKCKKSI